MLNAIDKNYCRKLPIYIPSHRELIICAKTGRLWIVKTRLILEIVSKTDKPGIDIFIKPGTKRKVSISL